MEYDNAGRLISIKKQINDDAATNKIVVQNEYDELGQLKKKTLSPSGGAGGVPLETLTYDYNIHGWLLGVNRDFIKDASNNYFGFDLGYDKAALIDLMALINAMTFTNYVYSLTQIPIDFPLAKTVVVS